MAWQRRSQVHRPGALISLIQLLRRGSQPRVASLGRIPGTLRFSDLARNPDNQTVPGLMIFRVESSLLYFNVDYVRETILARVRSETTSPKLVLCDLSASPHVDLQSASSLHELADELAASGISMQVVEARSSVRDRLRAAELDEKLGGIDRFRMVAQVVADFEHRQAV
ncbi:MAG TPA: sodium-independent anion transporter [Pyrinomonadaceae bacterium]